MKRMMISAIAITLSAACASSNSPGDMSAEGAAKSSDSKKKKGGNYIALADVGEPLIVFEGNETIDRVSGEFRYELIGKEKYDDIAFESARLRALMTQMNHFFDLKEEGSLPEGLDTAAIVAYAGVAIPKAIQSGEEIVGRAKSLNPPSDFKGFEARKVPAATKLLAGSIKDLTGAIVQGKNLLDRM